MTRFILIRHGETSSTRQGKFHGVTDIPLNSDGRNQAKALNKQFKKCPISYIYCSPMKRCIETASILKGKRKIPFKIEQNLCEINFGEWENITLNQMYKRNPRKMKAWLNNFSNFVMPKGENIRHMIKRVLSFWETVNKKYKGKNVNILLVTHGGPGKVILMKELGLSWKNFWKFNLSTASVSVIEVADKYTMVKLINGTQCCR